MVLPVATHPGRSGTDDCNGFTRTSSRRFRPDPSITKGVVDDRFLNGFDGDGRLVDA